MRQDGASIPLKHILGLEVRTREENREWWEWTDKWWRQDRWRSISHGSRAVLCRVLKATEITLQRALTRQTVAFHLCSSIASKLPFELWLRWNGREEYFLKNKDFFVCLSKDKRKFTYHFLFVYFLGIPFWCLFGYLSLSSRSKHATYKSVGFLYLC